jgi:hypothetical protein
VNLDDDDDDDDAVCVDRNRIDVSFRMDFFPFLRHRMIFIEK